MRSARNSVANISHPERPRRAKLRLFLWAMICALAVGLAGLGEPVEDMLRDLRNKVRSHPASGEIVVVGIDDKSLQQIKNWPWPRRTHGTIIDRLDRAGAKAIYFDIDFSSVSNPQDDEAMRQALARSRAPITLPVHKVVDRLSGRTTDLLPLVPFRQEVNLASINVWHNYQGIVRSLSYQAWIGQRPYPSLAAKIAGTSGQKDEKFPIDFAIEPHSVPTLSAVDIMEGKFDASQVNGKFVIIGLTSAQLGDTYLMPGHGMMAGVYLHALGAETLLAGTPVHLGWLLSLLLASLLVALIMRLKDARFGAACSMGAAAIFAVVPIVLESYSFLADVAPSLVLFLIVGGTLGWSSFKRFYRARGSLNAVSGLPNFNVLREEATGEGLSLIVAKIHNYAEIASALPSEGEEALVHQIAQRLTLVSPHSRLYQSDEGIFAWFCDPQNSAAADRHLDSVFGMFQGPLHVLDAQVDANITFGIDDRQDQPLASRIGSAVVASDDAYREGQKWKEYDPSQSGEIAWKLTLLGQLDQAIDAGDLWIAFQPKMDVSSRKIIGAEALARWDHPEKGAINPTDFVLAAEQSGRIGKLTDYVLARSIQAAAKMTGRGIEFNVAVNLSARLIDGMSLTATVSKLLTQHKLAPHCLTLEITETAALAGGGRDLEILKDLRDMGVCLSIDDYGTGLSTLDYMKRIPATEIKIDKSFIEAIEKSRSDRLMVHSTIQLAHSLGQKVVAEGVERPETLEMLAMMGCDVAQGYLIGHPLRMDELEKILTKERRAA